MTPRTYGDILVLEPRGTLDQDEMSRIERYIQESMNRQHFNIVINLRKVRHLDYRSLSALSRRQEKLRSFYGDLKLVGLSPYLRDILRFWGAESVFAIYRSQKEAIQSFRRWGWC